ncbi:hypothetical protein DRO33_01075 [Candidatus Bathyarchaeota archaeon]|nr:MAG: hypothetical protein DRO33_01075 [Candidatus Bathyarchaeota archaeon]
MAEEKKIEYIVVSTKDLSYEELDPKLREAVESGAAKCAICKGEITRDNIAVVYSEKGLTWFICSSCPGSLRATFLSERGPSFVLVGLDERDAVKV